MGLFVMTAGTRGCDGRGEGQTGELHEGIVYNLGRFARGSHLTLARLESTLNFEIGEELVRGVLVQALVHGVRLVAARPHDADGPVLNAVSSPSATAGTAPPRLRYKRDPSPKKCTPYLLHLLGSVVRRPEVKKLAPKAT